MSKATTTPTFADEAARALAKLHGLPQWFQTAAWGKDLMPLGERVASVVGPSVDAAELAELRAKVARVEVLHQKAGKREGVERCTCMFRWPCPTAMALEARA